jgi:hypothetical protein
MSMPCPKLCAFSLSDLLKGLRCVAMFQLAFATSILWVPAVIASFILLQLLLLFLTGINVFTCVIFFLNACVRSNIKSSRCRSSPFSALLHVIRVSRDPAHVLTALF